MSEPLSVEKNEAASLAGARPAGWQAPPSVKELLLLVVASFAVMWGAALVLHRSFGLVLEYGDNSAYREVANAILRWDFHNLYIQHFMGYPYFIAAVSLLFRVPTTFALWVSAAASSLVAVWCAARLFGTVVAGYFALTNLAWLQVSALGGSEPLAMALGLGAMVAFRGNRSFLAALLGALAVTVRPLMIFVLVGMGLVLLYRKQFRFFFVALGTGLVIALLYMLPLERYFGDPLWTVHSYTTHDYGGGGIAGPHGHLFGWPFHGIIAGTLAYPAPWTNLVLSFLWIGIVLAGVAMMFSEDFRSYAENYPSEAIFCGLYLVALFSYDYLIWARSNFMRFSIPVLPFAFFALLRFLPKNRRVFWCLSVVAAVLAMMSAIGIRNVMGHG